MTYPAQIYAFPGPPAAPKFEVNRSHSAAVLDWLGRWGIFGER